MPFYSKHKEIASFIESVDQVLNSNTVFIEQEFEPEGGILAYVDEAFRSGRFYTWMREALGDTDDKATHPLRLNMTFRMLPFSFAQFRYMLEEMLAVERSPYRVALSGDQIRFLVDDFLESTVNEGHEKSYHLRSAEIETSWRFYCIPREDGSMHEHEIDYPGADEEGLRKRTLYADSGSDVFDYFYNLGGDAFLVFHNEHKVYFLMTNGSD